LRLFTIYFCDENYEFAFKCSQFVPLEEMLTEFDDNGDGVISLDEFIAHLKDAPALWQAIHSNINPATGKLKGYVSLEQQLADLEAKAAPLDAKQVSNYE